MTDRCIGDYLQTHQQPDRPGRSSDPPIMTDIHLQTNCFQPTSSRTHSQCGLTIERFGRHVNLGASRTMFKGGCVPHEVSLSGVTSVSSSMTRPRMQRFLWPPTRENTSTVPGNISVCCHLLFEFRLCINSLTAGAWLDPPPNTTFRLDSINSTLEDLVIPPPPACCFAWTKHPRVEESLNARDSSEAAQ